MQSDASRKVAGSGQDELPMAPPPASQARDGRRAAAATSATVSTSSVYDKQLAWKLHGQRKLASKSQELKTLEAQECSFAPKTNRRTEEANRSRSSGSLDVSTFEDTDEDAAAITAAEAEAALLHPTESQESSIQLHLVRQERAREQTLEAQYKLSGGQSSKDFSKVTTCEPFALSVTNWKPRNSTTEVPVESPTRDTACVRPVECSSSSEATESQVPKKPSVSKPTVKAKTKIQVQTARGRSASPRCPHTPPCSAKEEAWESERVTLVSIIDAQRRELALREQAQQDAVRVAERFAAATQAFEERLVVVEQSAAKELEEVKSLLASQAAATDLILSSLGISRRPNTGDGSTRYE